MKCFLLFLALHDGPDLRDAKVGDGGDIGEAVTFGVRVLDEAMQQNHVADLLQLIVELLALGEGGELLANGEGDGRGVFAGGADFDEGRDDLILIADFLDLQNGGSGAAQNFSDVFQRFALGAKDVHPFEDDAIFHEAALVTLGVFGEESRRANLFLLVFRVLGSGENPREDARGTGAKGHDEFGGGQGGLIHGRKPQGRLWCWVWVVSWLAF